MIGIDASRAVTTQRTGTEAYATFLIRALIDAAGDRSQRLRLYFNRPPLDGLFPTASHVEQVVIPYPRLWTHVRLARELRQRPPDVFFTPAHVIPWRYRGASVATVHDLGYHYFPQAHTRRQLAYLRWSTRHNARVSRLVLADSMATRSDLQRFYAIDPAKVHVIYPGVDPDLRPVTDAVARTAVQHRYGLPDDYLLFLSTLQPRKNLERLVEAYAASGVTLPLVLAGKRGWLSEPIVAAVAALSPDVRARVLLPGYIAEPDKAALLSGARALLYPSLYEGFGFPLLEGQACGTAVLAANSSSLPEIAGDAALLVDPVDTAALADGIRRLTVDDRLRADLIRRGFINVQRFAWQDAAVRVLALLQQAACA